LRISGVEVGLVRSVVVKPEDHSCPVMVTMELLTDYELKVPRDSKAYAASEGLLGPAYIAIDSSDANAAPIENWGKLPSKVLPHPGTEDLLNYLSRILEQSHAVQQSSTTPSKEH
jgi:ABC-type transporter Mla subunit MlaD